MKIARFAGVKFGNMGAPKGNNYAEGKGGPSKYKPEFDNQAYKLCLLGATDKDLADFFEVDESTINNWKIDHESFFESIKEGKLITDMTIAEKLKNRAEGAVIKKDVAIKYKTGRFEEDIKIITLEEELPPDTTALIFWLKNRAGKYWRDKQEFDHTTKGEKITMTEEEYAERLAKARRIIDGDTR